MLASQRRQEAVSWRPLEIIAALNTGRRNAKPTTIVSLNNRSNVAPKLSPLIACMRCFIVSPINNAHASDAALMLMWPINLATKFNEYFWDDSTRLAAIMASARLRMIITAMIIESF